MRRTKDENQRRERGAYVAPDGDPVGVGQLSLAHARMGIAIGSVDELGGQSVSTVSEERRNANGADRFMRLLKSHQ